MNFLLGMAVGGMLFSGDGNPPASALAQIPLRCLYAFEQSESDYRACRMPSIVRELREGSTPCGYGEIKDDKHFCSGKRHLDWEVGALKALQERAKVKP